MLLLALLPEKLGWREAAECCLDACTCRAAEEPSCCETDAQGPVIVALCGCGMPHEPQAIHRVRVDWFANGPAPQPFFGPEPRAFPEAIGCAPRSHVEAPEPPPPRRSA